jgi:protein phosphatase
MPDSFAHLRVGAVTDVGVKRKNNEDSIITLPEHGVFCVADGMGGAEGGEVASQAAVSSLERAFGTLTSPEAIASANGKAHVIDVALNQASAWIKERSDKKGIKGSGTTAVVIAFDGRDPRRAMVVHAGDSRAYRYRDGRLTQISRDHTVAEAAGIKDDKELPSMFKGVVTRAVGVNRSVELERTPTGVKSGDVYLLASDGLDKLIKDPEIEQFIRDHYDPDRMQELAQLLVDTTNARGGVDNVSVIAVWVGEADEASLTPGVESDDRLSTERITGGFGLNEGDEPSTDESALPTGDYVGLSPLDGSPTGDGLPAAPAADNSDGKLAPGAPLKIPSKLPLLVGNGLVAVILLGWLFSRSDKGAAPDGDDWKENELEAFKDPDKLYGPATQAPEPAGDADAMLEKLAAEIAGTDSGAASTTVPVVPPGTDTAPLEQPVQAIPPAPPRETPQSAVKTMPSPVEEEPAEPPTVVPEPPPSLPEVAPPSDVAARQPGPDEPPPAGSEAESTEIRQDEAIPAEATPPAGPSSEELAAAEAAAAEAAAQEARLVNRAAFDAATQELNALVPASIAEPGGLAAAEATFRAIRAFEEREWPDVDPAQVRERARMVRAVLAKQAELTVRDLRDGAMASLRAGEDDNKQARALEALGAQAPSIAALIGPQYQEAVSTVEEMLKQRETTGAFEAAVGRIRERLRTTGDLNAEGQALEQAALALESVAIRDWGALPANMRKDELASIRADIGNASDAYVGRVEQQALEALEAKKAQSPAADLLDEFETEFPTISGISAPQLKSAQRAVARVRMIQADQSRFADAVREVREAMPDPLTSPQQIPAAERSAVLWSDYRERIWRNIDAAQRSESFDELGNLLREQVLQYVQQQHDNAVAQYDQGKDGGEALQNLRDLAAQAPTLKSLIAIEYARQRDHAERAWARFNRAHTFMAGRDRVLQVLPDAIASPEDLDRAEQALAAYRELAGESWEDVPSAASELARVETLLRERGAVYLDRILARAEPGEGQEPNPDAAQAELAEIARHAPQLGDLWKQGIEQAQARIGELRARQRERELQAQAERRTAGLQRLRAELPQYIDEAALTGRWGELANKLAALGAEAESLLEQSGNAPAYRAWLEAWTEAKSDTEAAEAAVLSIHRSVGGVCAAAGVAPPASVSFGGGEADAQASAICAARKALQDHVVDQMTKVVAVHPSAAFGPAEDLEPALVQLETISGANDPDSLAAQLTETYVRAQAPIEALRQWLKGIEPGPVPAAKLDELAGIGLGEAAAHLDAFWDGIFRVIDPDLLDVLDQSFRQGWFQGHRFDRIEGLEEALRGLENAALDFVDSRVPFEDIRTWREDVGERLLGTVISEVRKVGSLIPAKER